MKRLLLILLKTIIIYIIAFAFGSTSSADAQQSVTPSPASGRNVFLWPDGVIPYSFAGSNFNEDGVRLILKCLLEIEASTCLRFRLKGDYETDFIEFYATPATESSICRAAVVGYAFGKNRVLLGPGCFTPRSLYHEILHAVGLHHEHQRPDRDRYVTINYDNIVESHQRDFDIKPSFDERLLSQTEYDYFSVTHYEADAFAITKGSLTIEAKNASLSRFLGKSEQPSKGDYRKLEILYKDICKHHQRMQSPASVPTFDTFKADSNTVALWPRGVVPFKFAQNVTESQRQVIRQAMANIEQETCVKFAEDALTNQPGYVEFQVIDNSAHLRSGVDSTGAVFGKKTFRLKPDSFTNERLFNWWLLVALGMLPEVRRPDRDHFVKINWRNVNQENWDLLAKYSQLDERLLSISYDLESVMHYGSDAFASRQGLETISTLKNGKSNIGKSTRPTRLDFQKINALYSCKAIVAPTAGDPRKSMIDSMIDGVDEIREPINPAIKTPNAIEVGPSDQKESVNPPNENGHHGAVELAVILSAIAGVVIIMVGLIVIIRYRQRKAKGGNRRQAAVSGAALRGRAVGDGGDDDSDDDDNNNDQTSSTTAMIGKQQQQQQKRHVTVQYRQLPRQDQEPEQQEQEHQEEA